MVSWCLGLSTEMGGAGGGEDELGDDVGATNFCYCRPPWGHVVYGLGRTVAAHDHQPRREFWYPNWEKVKGIRMRLGGIETSDYLVKLSTSQLVL